MALVSRYAYPYKIAAMVLATFRHGALFIERRFSIEIHHEGYELIKAVYDQKGAGWRIYFNPNIASDIGGSKYVVSENLTDTYYITLDGIEIAPKDF